MSAQQIPLAIAKVVELGIAAGAAPLNKLEGCWEYQIDARWWIAMNGHKQDRLATTGEVVKPFTVYIKYNGWPAGILDFGGGIIAAGEGANENTFIAAIEVALAKASS